MAELKHFVTPLHQATKRDYLARMIDDKVSCMKIAKQYEYDYWDGDRRYGYGGYKYIPGRWKPVAEALIETYKLGPGSRILDIGCGKGFLLHEIALLEPEIKISGFDISKHGIEQATDVVKPNLFMHRAEKPYPFDNDEFDLTIVGWVLRYTNEHEKSINEVIRVTKNNGIISICNSTGRKYVKIFSEDYIDSSEAILHSSSKLLSLFKDSIGEVIFKYHPNDEVNKHILHSKHSNYLIKIKK